ncbi:unnamed protein product [Cyclocybe aegerita]|uniref:Uncharacterized protein n=1 Tax=Cyclocybe aegerita TaxID=1973307 RepID=A0A8S0WY75_CYCAE|nr:unnamed protein product [Cyclocybe aegerita]
MNRTLFNIENGASNFGMSLSHGNLGRMNIDQPQSQGADYMGPALNGTSLNQQLFSLPRKRTHLDTEADYGSMMDMGDPLQLAAMSTGFQPHQTSSTQVIQLAQDVDNLEGRVYTDMNILKKLINEKHTSVMKRIMELEAELAQMKDQVAELTKHRESDSGSTQTSGGSALPQKENDKEVIIHQDAVQAQMKALIGVAERHVNNKIVLNLPCPCTELSEDRFEEVPGVDGTPPQYLQLWNPNWHVTGTKDNYNVQFINAVLTFEYNQQYQIKPKRLEEPFPMIKNAAFQYLCTLSGKYMTTIDQVAYCKAVSKNEKTKHLNARKAKYAHCATGFKIFEKRHGITGVSAVVTLEYTSDEDTGPGNVSQEDWDKEAGKHCPPGATAVEILWLLTRDETAMWIAYALDKIAIELNKARVHYICFHGLPENADINLQKAAPGTVTPACIVSKQWQEAYGEPGNGMSLTIFNNTQELDIPINTESQSNPELSIWPYLTLIWSISEEFLAGWILEGLGNLTIKDICIMASLTRCTSPAIHGLLNPRHREEAHQL